MRVIELKPRNGPGPASGAQNGLTDSSNATRVRGVKATTPMTVHQVLAGAYRGKRSQLDAMLTHASRDDGETAVCDNAGVASTRRKAVA